MFCCRENHTDGGLVARSQFKKVVHAVEGLQASALADFALSRPFAGEE